MNAVDDYSLLYKISRHYYIDNMSQQEIAQKFGVSRPQISRILKKAREMGIVQINIKTPNNESANQLSRRIQELYNLKEVIVTPNLSISSEDGFFIEAAADYLSKKLPGYTNIGIGWGSTLYEISLSLDSRFVDRHINFYPLIGSAGTDKPYFQTNNICDRFARKFNANANFMNLPVIVSEDKLTEIDKSRFVQILKIWENLDIAVIGIGGRQIAPTPYTEEFLKFKEITDNFAYIIGDILGCIFLKDGGIIELPKGYSLSSIPGHTLKKIPEVICVAMGLNKTEALIFGMKNKFFNILVTDEATAKSLVVQSMT